MNLEPKLEQFEILMTEKVGSTGLEISKIVVSSEMYRALLGEYQAERTINKCLREKIEELEKRLSVTKD